MKSLVELILEQNIEELKIKRKIPHAQGYDHIIYKNLKDPNKLFKVKDYGEHSYDDVDWIKIFKSNPEYFPKIFRHNDKGAEVEKLDVVKAQKEFEELNKDIPDNIGSFKGLLGIISTGSNKKHTDVYVKEYFEYLKNNKPEMASKFLKWIKLISDISKISGLDRLDIHSGNFGYDKQGKLKMLDI